MTAVAPTESTTATLEAPASAVSTAKAPATTLESASATKASGAARPAGKAVLAYLDVTAVPVVAIELMYGILGIVTRLIHDNARALGATVVPKLDIGAYDLSSGGWTI